MFHCLLFVTTSHSAQLPDEKEAPRIDHEDPY